jgi:hypothetical protein
MLRRTIQHQLLDSGSTTTHGISMYTCHMYRTLEEGGRIWVAGVGSGQAEWTNDSHSWLWFFNRQIYVSDEP